MGEEFGNDEAARRSQAAAEAAHQAAQDGDGQGEMFPAGSIEGEGKTLKTLIKAGLPVELTCSIGKAEVPLRNGLPDPDRPVRALVTGIFHKAEPVAKRDGEDTKVTGWKLRVHMRADYTETVPSDDAGLIEQRFKAMLEVSASEAGNLLERLQALAAESLTAV